MNKYMEKYLELKKLVEEFLELRKNINNRKDLYETNGLGLLDYLYVINYVIYGSEKSFSEDIKREIKNEIREWSIFFSQRGKNEPLGGYSVKLIPKEMENKKKVEEVKQINIKIDELRNKIVKISTEIYENNIYPF